MVKCSECGFLAVWHAKNNQFLEASEHFRENGTIDGARPEDLPTYQAKCHALKARLQSEVVVVRQLGNVPIDAATLTVISTQRNCDGFTRWVQGFSAKEHREMLDKASQRRQNTLHLMIAFFAAVVAAVGIAVSGYYTDKAAGRGADAQLKAAQMQIDAQREFTQMQINAARELARQGTTKPNLPSTPVAESNRKR